MARLQPAYTAEQAAAIAGILIRNTVAQAVDNWPGDVYLYGYPDRNHPLFHELAQDLRIRLVDQGAGEVSRRMYAALCDGIARRGAAAVLGCDVPHCPQDVLEAAHEHLARGHNVIGPCMGEGHYLIGLQQADPVLFTGTEQATSQAMTQIAARAAQAGLEFEALPVLRGVHTPQDLRAVAQACTDLRPFLPVTGIRSIPIVSRPAGD